jgi:hypothetical protein
LTTLTRNILIDIIVETGNSMRERERERERDRQTDRQTDRQRDREREREMPPTSLTGT